MKTLLLWDIDGTLITSGGAGIRALRPALHDLFGITAALDDIDYAGRTDRHIFRQIFVRHGIPDTEENFLRYLDGYIAKLPGELANPNAYVLPGVPVLLAAAAKRPDLTQALLTGNVCRAARVKLAHHGLWDFFPFGAFADDSEHRNDLGPHALRRAREHTGVDFPPGRVWVIGDTPHDIACGRAIGARTLAVATGSHTVAALAEHQPTAVLSDLNDAAAFWRLIDAV
ncbi:MAG: HAD hydrolase-like protein [Undibacterium sp.]|nr:HAD hydrolase-like protein [Opitutaceae bacterium]